MWVWEGFVVIKKICLQKVFAIHSTPPEKGEVRETPKLKRVGSG